MSAIGAAKVNDQEFELLKSIRDDVGASNVAIKFLFRRNAFKRTPRYGSSRMLNSEGREWVLASAYIVEVGASGGASGYVSVSNKSFKERFNFSGSFVRGSANSYVPTARTLSIMVYKLRLFIDRSYNSLLTDASDLAVKLRSRDQKRNCIKTCYPSSSKIEVYGRSFNVHLEWGTLSVEEDGRLTSLNIKGEEGLSIRDLISKLAKAEVREVIKDGEDDDIVRRARLLRPKGGLI